MVEAAARVATGARTYVELQLEQLRLLVPQATVLTLESTLDVHLSVDRDADQTRLRYPTGNGEWLIYDLDQELRLVLRPPSRRICVLLKLGNDEGYGLLCDGVRVLPVASDRLQAIPKSMCRPDSPLQALVHDDQGVACVIDAAALARHLGVDNAPTPPSPAGTGI